MQQRFIRVTAAVVAMALFVGCSSGDDDGDAEEPAPTTSTTSTTTTTALPAPVEDQTPPAGSNGIVMADSRSVWIAVLDGNELIRVDVATGDILDRRATPDASGPDDLVLSDDGVLYWTGYTSGLIGSIDLEDGSTATLATVPFGANPITFDDDGTLLVGLAVLDTGLYRVDPDAPAGTEPEELLADDQAMNAFDVGDDGFLYGPTTDGSVLRVDVGADPTEIVGPIASGLGFAVAVRFAPDGSMWVLTSVGEPRLSQIDPETGVVGTEIPLEQLVADNFAIAEDGTMYVTGFNDPVITVVNPEDGSLTSVPIGGAA